MSEQRDLREDLEICEKATPGPWAWEGNTSSHSLWLIQRAGWRNIVMDFVRWGAQSAQPRFNRDGLMEKVIEFFKPRESHHKNFDLDVDHPDAIFIAQARTGWPEAIERAIAAEAKNTESYDLLYIAFEKEMDEAEQLRSDNATLREENDLQRHSIQQLSAQVVGLREAAINFGCYAKCAMQNNTPEYMETYWSRFEAFEKVVDSADPGAEIMERMKMLEAVAEAAKKLDFWNAGFGHSETHTELVCKLNDALADLEGGR